MSKKIHYAFIESLEYLPEEIVVTFDTISRSSHEKNLEEKNLSELPTEIIQISLGLDDLSKIYKWKKLYLHRWYKLILSEDKGNGLPCRQYQLPLRENSYSNFNMEEMHLLAPSDTATKNLKATYSFDNLDDLEQAQLNEAQLQKMLESITPENDFFGCVKNVGQGSCNCFTDFNGENYGGEFLYLALGGGFGSNKSTYPDKVDFTPTEQAIHILCHWDMDHWMSSEYYEKPLEKVRWIAPKQRNVGPTHIKKAQQLIDNGTLFFWPDKLTSKSTNFLHVYKLPDHDIKNYSGLIVAVKTSKDSDKYFFYSGDAPFSRCKTLTQSLQNKIHVIAIPHHGGKMPFRSIIKAPVEHIAICSYGKNNTYGHPYKDPVQTSRNTKTRYTKKGWKLWLETALEGDVYFYSGTNHDTWEHLILNFGPNFYPLQLSKKLMTP